MKKIFSWIVLIVAAIAFVGCTKNGGTDEGSILGTWRAYRLVLEYPDGSVMWAKDVWNDYATYTFKENGEVVVSQGGESEHGNYFISGDQLTLSNGSDSNTATIRTLTATELVIAYKDSEGDSNALYFKRVN